MSSKILSVTFKNFFNFYGSVEFLFENGLNIVSAPNGGGKTNFLSGIRWIATDELYFGGSVNTYKRVIPGRPCKELKYALNMRAKAEAAVGDIIKASVALIYSDSSKMKFEIVKSFSAEKVDEDINSDRWNFTVEQPRVIRLGYADLSPLSSEKAQHRLNSFIGSQFHAYTLLKGEEIDKTIDFANEASVRQMIESLTNISFYKSFLEKLEIAHEKIGSKYIQTVKVADKNASTARVYEEKIKSLSKKIKLDETKLQRNQDQYSKVNDELLKIENELGIAENREKIRREIDSLEKNQFSVSNSHSSFTSSINEQLFSDNKDCFSFKNSGILETYKNKVDEYKYKRRQLVENETIADTLAAKLPFESPDSTTLMQMLNEGKCFVCGRSAEEGSRAHDHIGDLIKYFKEEREQRLKAQKKDGLDLLSFLGVIEDKVRGAFYGQEAAIVARMRNYMEEEAKYGLAIDRLEADLSRLKAELANYGGHNESDHDKNLILKVRNLSTDKGSLGKDIEYLEREIDDDKLERRRAQKDLHNLTENADEDIGLKNGEVVFESLIKTVQDISSNAYHDYIEKLEISANQQYRELVKFTGDTEESDVDGLTKSTLRFDTEERNGQVTRITIHRVSKDGTILHGASTAYELIKKLAIVMAIMDLKRKQSPDFYIPFVADAPTSNMMESLSKGFFERLPKVYEQSIIFTKDLYGTDNRLNILGEYVKNIVTESQGTFYTLHFQIGDELTAETMVERIG